MSDRSRGRDPNQNGPATGGAGKQDFKKAYLAVSDDTGCLELFPHHGCVSDCL